MNGKPQKAKGLGPWISRNTRRLIGFALAPSLIGLAFEAGIGHYAGSSKAGSNDLQIVPVYFGIGGGLLALVLCFLKPAAFRIGMKVTGLISFVVGVLGVALHVWAFIEDLIDKKVFQETGSDLWDALETAFGAAPPAFAPGAFTMVGLLLYVLGSKNALIRLRLPPKRPARAAATVQSNQSQAGVGK
jgi:hypothetical protein